MWRVVARQRTRELRLNTMGMVRVLGANGSSLGKGCFVNDSRGRFFERRQAKMLNNEFFSATLWGLWDGRREACFLGIP